MFDWVLNYFPNLIRYLNNIHTFPSHRSVVLTFIVLCNHLLWNSLPSKKFQGQQNSQGTGDPQASLARIAYSIPFIKIAANWMHLKINKYISASEKETSLNAISWVTINRITKQKNNVFETRVFTLQTFTCSKSTIETLEKGVKHV